MNLSVSHFSNLSKGIKSGCGSRDKNLKDKTIKDAKDKTFYLLESNFRCISRLNLMDGIKLTRHSLYETLRI